MQQTPLKLFIDDECGGVLAVAEETSLSVRAIYKWAKKGSLPRTEFTSETNYSKNLSDLSGISADEIKNRFKPQPQPQQQPEPEEV